MAEHDDAGYVPEDVRQEWEAKDPIDSYRRYLTDGGHGIAEEDLKAIDDRIEKELEKDVRDALDAPFPEPDVHAEDAYAR